MGNTSIDISHDLEIEDQDQKPNLIANGFVTCVWFNFKENKKRPSSYSFNRSLS